MLPISPSEQWALIHRLFHLESSWVFWDFCHIGFLYRWSTGGGKLALKACATQHEIPQRQKETLSPEVLKMNHSKLSLLLCCLSDSTTLSCFFARTHTLSPSCQELLLMSSNYWGNIFFCHWPCSYKMCHFMQSPYSNRSLYIDQKHNFNEGGEWEGNKNGRISSAFSCLIIW